MSVRNLVHACPPSLKRFVLTTSAGVERSGQFPFSILNLFGARGGPGCCFIQMIQNKASTAGAGLQPGASEQTIALL